jgi:hypothetical protein
MTEFVVTGDTLICAGREFAAGRVVDLEPEHGAVLVEKGRVAPVEAETPKPARRSRAKPDPESE